LKPLNWSTVMQLRNTDMSFEELVRDLNITHLLTCREQSGEQNIQLTVQLIDAKDNTTVWQESYDSKPEEIFDIQNSVVEGVTRELGVEISAEFRDQIQKQPTENKKAYDLYRRGRWFWNQRTPEGLKRSIQYYELAVQEDPNFALPYAGIAEAFVLSHLYGYLTGGETHQRAMDAAQKALAIDSTLGEAYSCLGMIKVLYDWDWEQAEKDFKKAIELNPSYATAHHWYAEYLHCMARPNESAEEYRIAMELDPLSLAIQRAMGIRYLDSKEYDLAIRLLNNVIEISPEFPWAYSFLGHAYYKKELYQEALDVYDKAIEIELNAGFSIEGLKILAQDFAVNPKALAGFKKMTEEWGRAQKSLDELRNEMELLGRDQEALSGFKREMDRLFRDNLSHISNGMVYIKMGREEEARKIAKIYKNIISWSYGTVLRRPLVLLYFALGEYELGFSYLEYAVENKDYWVISMRIDSDFENVRSYPRFKALLKKMNLE
ncbi:tetratricopeptide repeat protein, partial [Acidobacteriota bacterium]